MSGLPPENVIEYGRNLREKYYRDRVKASKLPPEVIKNIYQEIPEETQGYGLTEDECINLIAKEHNLTDSIAFKESYTTATEVFYHVLRSGIITLSDDDECQIPIPSLRAFVDELVERSHKRGGARQLGAE